MIGARVNRPRIVRVDGHGIDIAQFRVASRRNSLPGFGAIRRTKDAAARSSHKNLRRIRRLLHGAQNLPGQSRDAPGGSRVAAAIERAARTHILKPYRGEQLPVLPAIDQKLLDHRVMPRPHAAT